ncbi:MAG: glycosyltransferase family 39 protein, partial [Verrucomicrobia bacterium]|nr:glycosyltransferase family 39 protein [Verrucomicrobiota bacterium]
MERGEFVSAFIFLALLAAMKLANITSFRFDSDEPQHAHVVWAWTRGFVQYRDVFDNHMPLFHIMWAPIYGLIGDGPHVLVFLRLTLLPVQLATAFAIYRIGEGLFSRKAGIWAVVLAGFYPGYHIISLEFRTDNVWTLFWLLSVMELVAGPINTRRVMRAGALMGLAFAISLKSVLLLIS